MNKQKAICGKSKPQNVPPGRKAKRCVHCGAWFHLPRCHADRHKCCSSECNSEMRAQIKKARERSCKNCGQMFVPRVAQINQGQGVYCSMNCVSDVLQTYKTPEMEKKRIAAIRERIAAGEWTYHEGEDNPLWQGGPVEARRRDTESGKAKERLRRYRKNNPERVREWSHKRGNAYVERLPYGTVPKLLESQKGKCAFCLTKLGDDWHVDHIMPISKGGKHEPKNLQILCPPCNLRKSNLLPHEFAQRNGRLL